MIELIVFGSVIWFLVRSFFNTCVSVNNVLAKSKTSHVPDHIVTPDLIKEYSRRSELKMDIVTFFDDLKRPIEDSKLPIRTVHSLLIGRSGMGKTTVVESIIQQIFSHPNQGNVIVVDPHGSLTNKVAKISTFYERNNILLSAQRSPLTTVWSPQRLPNLNISREYLAGSLAEALEYEFNMREATLMKQAFREGFQLLGDLPLIMFGQLFQDQKFRERLLKKHSVTVMCRQFFDLFDSLSPSEKKKRFLPALNRIQSLICHEPIRLTLCGHIHKSISLATLCNDHNGKSTILLDLNRAASKGAASTLGSLFFASLMDIIFARITGVENIDNRLPWLHVFLDEYIVYAIPKLFGSLLSESRKYRCSLYLLNQSLSQIQDPQFLGEIMGNTSRQYIFNVDGKTARQFEDYLGRDARRIVADLKPYEGILIDKDIGNTDVAHFKTKVVQTPNIQPVFLHQHDSNQIKDDLNNLVKSYETKSDKTVKSVKKKKNSKQKRSVENDSTNGENLHERNRKTVQEFLDERI